MKSEEASDFLQVLVQVACRQLDISPEQANTKAGKIAIENVKDMEPGETKCLAFHSGKTEASKALKQGSDNSAAANAAKAATHKTIETANAVGVATVGLGVVFLIWHVVNIVEDSKRPSHGDTLREIAQEMENHLHHRRDELRD